MKPLFLAPLLLLAAPLAAQDMSVFKTGPVFTRFGPHAPVEGIGEVPADSEFAVAFDVLEPADEGKLNRRLESAARFINMHVAHGVAEENIRVAVVVHGKAVNDLLAKPDNTSADMVQVMLEHGVRFIVCGQSAAVYGVTQEDLIPGVEMALSAMTAHALLQQAGYTENPF
ncbi:DsrE family protein [Qipengyuania qiaonensis]|uniref:DsrE family protein n=1 Tax=Qipengyuania qiaonensis TaxID=2867240 RepID=A0ABS7J9D6_9SPHN|nr:DsrE family protein [Qipengyuania qiaonensis]MBX7483938.1 DsrE family protein [Qipengyuania qiaonensis]